ncbi:MAG TPA: MaoC/PaaZ C-terminal domain-containing protein [Solirubrobacteraceae bacterium]|nr:MaoC/PaaZ C-terminal domain-containing protein [Solirubrobacteraceae bacterium]
METERLGAPPDLAPLYVRAVLGPVLPGGGDELPDRRLEVSDLEVDRDHLAAYDRVCGFRLNDELPATYPHVLAFPLAMRLMTDRSFPFSLLGLVHVTNRIDQRRPLRADEPLDLRVWAEDLRPHSRGRQFDLVAEAEADGDVVWSDRSTYLRQGEGASEGSSGGPRDQDPEPEEPIATWNVLGDVGRRYAEVSGDRNPIHLHSLSARLFGVRGPIAHGMWMKARCLAALEGRLPAACRAEVRFSSPLRIPSKVGFAARQDDTRWRVALRSQGSDRPHLTGSIEPLDSPAATG